MQEIKIDIIENEIDEQRIMINYKLLRLTIGITVSFFMLFVIIYVLTGYKRPNNIKFK
jgi:hypothetical protein